MTISNLFKDILSSSKSKVRNPIIAGFVTSWLVYNWDIVYTILCSDKNVSETILIVKSIFNEKDGSISYPLYAALFHSIALPYISLVIDYFSKWSTKIKIKRVGKLEGDQLDVKIELAEKEYELELQKTGKKTQEELNGRISTLENEKKELIRINSEQSEQTNKSLETINEKNNELVKVEEELSILKSKLNSYVEEKIELSKETANNKEELSSLKQEYNSVLDKIQEDLLENKTPFITQYIDLKNRVKTPKFFRLIRELSSFELSGLMQINLKTIKYLDILFDERLIEQSGDDRNAFYLTGKGQMFLKYAKAFNDLFPEAIMEEI